MIIQDIRSGQCIMIPNQDLTIDHGTYAGWNQHKRHNIPMCDDCRHAQALYTRDYRNRKGAGRALFYPLELTTDADIGVGSTLARGFRESA